MGVFDVIGGIGDKFGLSGSMGFSSTSGSSATSGSSTTESNRTAGSQESRDALANLTKFLMENVLGGKSDTTFSKETALKDSSLAVDALFNKFKSTTLPDIIGAQTSAGAYGSTGAQALANDAYAATVREGAALQLDTIAKYTQLGQSQQQLQMQALLSSLGLEQSAVTEQIDKSTFKSNTDSKSKSRSFGLKLG